MKVERILLPKLAQNSGEDHRQAARARMILFLSSLRLFAACTGQAEVPATRSAPESTITPEVSASPAPSATFTPVPSTTLAAPTSTASATIAPTATPTPICDLESVDRSLALPATPPDRQDYFVFSTPIYHEPFQFYLYQVDMDAPVRILSNCAPQHFALSGGRMAFTAPDEVGQDIYITDFPFTEASPINLTQNPDRDDMIGAWSQDGQQLAFISSGPCGKAISIWDGKRVFTVGHFEGSIRSYWNFRWSTEGKLAFIVTSAEKLSDGTNPDDLWIWDGDQLLNLTQQSDFPVNDFAWSGDGRLAFIQEKPADYKIPGFYVTQSRKERWKLENPLFLRKMEQFRPIVHHFYAKIAMLGRIGKGSNERLAGSDFHPVGERNVAGGSHVKILNP